MDFGFVDLNVLYSGHQRVSALMWPSSRLGEQEFKYD
jgi:hypothetical protein